MNHSHSISSGRVVLAVCAILGLASFSLPALANMALAFPKDDYQIKTIHVQTKQGQRTIVVHHYQAIPYVSKPIDLRYQSLNIDVPVEIDHQTVNVAQAPVILNITVGGYMSASIPLLDEVECPRVANLPHPPRPPMGQMPHGLPMDGRMGPPLGMGQPMLQDDMVAMHGQAMTQSDDIRSQAAVFPGIGSDKANLALAAGYVVVTPGVRGWDNQSADGRYFGKAPAAIVDLKAAVRYLHFNAATIPGNENWIVSFGCSAGGALSALLGASGNQSQYQPYLDKIGAANASDAIFASACYSPITDLEHADGAYEWMFGKQPFNGRLVNQKQSKELVTQFDSYIDRLQLQGVGGYGVLTAANYREYLKSRYLTPALERYLNGLSLDDRKIYLDLHSWIRWDGQHAQFTWGDFVADMGRLKGLPAFDALDLSAPENKLFGSEYVNANHFSEYMLRQATNDTHAALTPQMVQLTQMMNPMMFLLKNHQNGVAQYWWLRTGAKDNNTSPTVLANLAAGLVEHGKQVNAAYFWEGGHCADANPHGAIDWVREITGYQR
ncbi:subtype B tannase [Vibrio tritonius]|uniref:subtype B tannase n=1 Tax=Vibrio tritonius TaxID=1435069 RepID=UPI00315D62A6